MKKTELWRIIAAIISACYIVYMWTEKDIASIYATMPQEQIVPMVATTIAVAVGKIALVAIGVILLKWIMKKMKKR